ncbi:hypothetical protein AMS68_001607 [Peltaster fructicola]|uniref:AB hydrolase-1 domain-containing protein n=1 Tax=Peltaster fructicola TaxID=286661 RepID=A0A6H0XNM8_9PEZI|nr:hypothetical protein AMS68_001607 [Peltaster fructicola]
MITHSVPTLIGVLIGITFLRSIAPLSFLYTCWNAYDYVVNGKYAHTPLLITLHIYCSAEAVFLLFFVLYYRPHMQIEAVHPPLRTKAQRRQLFDKVHSEITNPAQFISGWFRGAKIEDIGREQLREFLNWSFWEGRATAEDAEELDEYVRLSEEYAGVELKEHGVARPLRLTLDPVEMDYRSLLWYGIIMLLDVVASVRFQTCGFEYHRTSWSSAWVFPPTLAALSTNKCSPSTHLSYWFRPHTSKTRHPILFLHGVGIGLQSYVDFLHLLDVALNQHAAADDKVGILALEFLPISSRLTCPVLRRDVFNGQLLEILDKHAFEQVVLVNHSYGSIASSHILTDDAVSARISAVLSIDPVTILLHLPDVAFNFTIRAPKKANEWQLWYFASKDPGISHTLGRHLFWYESVLWRDRIIELVNRGMNFTVSLSGQDLIVDTPAVARYLLVDDKPTPIVKSAEDRQVMELQSSQTDIEFDELTRRPWKGQGLEVLWWNDFDHAQVMDDTESIAKLISVICQYCQVKKRQ